MISVADLRVRFNGHEAVAGVSFTVGEGEWLSLVGPNGAGKSSLLKAVAGVIGFSGEVRLDGEAISAMPRRRRARLVALVPQHPETPAGMTVAEYVLLGRTPHLSFLASEGDHDRAVAAAAIARLDLSGLERRQLGSLSGGELQRAVLARSITAESPVLLLDEPTTALDVGHQQEVLELVDWLRLSGKLTVLSALHDLTAAAQFAHRLLLMDRGRIVAAGPPIEVLTEDNIRRHFGANVEVWQSPAGPVVVPRRQVSTSPAH